jgi:hypothetical protein
MRKLLIMLAALATSTVLAAAPPLTPRSIRIDIHRSGAKAVVDRLFASGQYEVIMSRIKAGSPDWVLLAKALSDGTDAASSEELQQALVHALPKSPGAVLSVLDGAGPSVPTSAQTVCSASFFEGDRVDVAAYRAVAIKAVKSVDLPALRGARAQCLKVLSSH